MPNRDKRKTQRGGGRRRIALGRNHNRHSLVGRKSSHGGRVEHALEAVSPYIL